MSMVDDVNAKMDSTVKAKGYKHREDFHSLDPLRKDSIEVTKFNPKREVLRKLHIIEDTSPQINRMAKLLGLYRDVQTRKKVRLHKRH
jgi:hypothetical protein